MIKKLMFSGLFIALILSSCKKREVREEWIDDHLIEQFYVIETDNGSFIKDGEYKSWFFSDQIERDGQYEDGIREGNWKGWYGNGQIEFDCNYVNGIFVGSFVKWHKNGQVSYQETYDNKGNLNGTQTYWHSNGEKSKEATYVNGIKDGTYRTWDSDGYLSIDKVFKKGVDVNLPLVYKSSKGYKLELKEDSTFIYMYLKDIGNFWQRKWVWKTREGIYSYTDDKFILEKFYKYNLEKFTSDTIVLDKRIFVRVDEEGGDETN